MRPQGRTHSNQASTLTRDFRGRLWTRLPDARLEHEPPALHEEDGKILLHKQTADRLHARNQFNEPMALPSDRWRTSAQTWQPAPSNRPSETNKVQKQGFGSTLVAMEYSTKLATRHDSRVCNRQRFNRHSKVRRSETNSQNRQTRAGAQSTTAAAPQSLSTGRSAASAPARGRSRCRRRELVAL
jgi:hypothetical protein